MKPKVKQKEYTFETLPDNCIFEVLSISTKSVGIYIKCENLILVISINNKLVLTNRTITTKDFTNKYHKITSIKELSIGPELIPQPTEYLIVDEDDTILARAPFLD